MKIIYTLAFVVATAGVTGCASVGENYRVVDTSKVTTPANRKVDLTVGFEPERKDRFLTEKIPDFDSGR